MYENVFLNRFNTFSEVVAFVNRMHPPESALQPRGKLIGPRGPEKFGRSPNRSYFLYCIRKANGFLLKELLIDKEELSAEEIEHNDKLSKDLSLIHNVCNALFFQNTEDFHPPMPCDLQRPVFGMSFSGFETQYNAYRCEASFKEQQHSEYEAQFAKIGLVFENEEVMAFLNSDVGQYEGALALTSFHAFAETLLTEKEIEKRNEDNFSREVCKGAGEEELSFEELVQRHNETRARARAQYAAKFIKNNPEYSFFLPAPLPSALVDEKEVASVKP